MGFEICFNFSYKKVEKKDFNLANQPMNQNNSFLISISSTFKI